MNHELTDKKTSAEEIFLFVGEEDTDKPLSDREFFIRKVFETNPRKGCELLFKQYYKPLCSHAARFVYSRQVAEDLVVEVFSNLWQSQLYTHISSSYRAYLFTAVRHRAFTHLRNELKKENEVLDTESLTHPSLSPSPEQMLQYNELHLKIEKIIQSLHPQSQRIFLMSRYEGKQNQTIADDLQISIKTVEAHMTKVLALFRKYLKDDLIWGVCLVGSSLLDFFI